MDPIQWASVPAHGDRLSRIPITYIRPGTKYRVRIVGRQVAVWIHWLHKGICPPSGRSLPCLGECCPAARHAEPVREARYVAALLEVRGERWIRTVLLLSESMSYELLDLDPAQGIVAVVERARGGGAEARFAELRCPAEFPDALNASYDISPALHSIWGMRQGLPVPDAAENGEVIKFPTPAPAPPAQLSPPTPKPKENA